MADPLPTNPASGPPPSLTSQHFAFTPEIERLQHQLDALGIAAITPSVAELSPPVQAPAFFRAVEARHIRRLTLLYGSTALIITIVVCALLFRSWIGRQFHGSPAPATHHNDITPPPSTSPAPTSTTPAPSTNTPSPPSSSTPIFSGADASSALSPEESRTRAALAQWPSHLHLSVANRAELADNLILPTVPTHTSQPLLTTPTPRHSTDN